MATKKDCSLADCKELKDLIVCNPSLTLITFVSEDAKSGDYSYMWADVNSYCIDELALRIGDRWCDYDSFYYYFLVFCC